VTGNGDQGPTCGGCRHYVESGPEQGICYYNPPVPFPVPTGGAVALPGNQGAAGVAVIQLRPPVGLVEIACARFERLEESPGDR